VWVSGQLRRRIGGAVELQKIVLPLEANGLWFGSAYFLALRCLALVLSVQNVSHGRKLVVFRIVLLDWVSHYLTLGLQVRVASLLHEITVHSILQQFFELIASWRLPRQIKGPG